MILKRTATSDEAALPRVVLQLETLRIVEAQDEGETVLALESLGMADWMGVRQWRSADDANAKTTIRQLVAALLEARGLTP
jgi:hypothetical protein